MLRRIFEREWCWSILIGIALATELDGRKLSFDEGTVIISKNCDRGGIVMNLELEDIVLFYLELGYLEEGGWILVVAHVVLAWTDLEDDYQNQQ